MALFTLDQLLTKTTKDQIANQIFAFMTAAGLPVTSWEALSPLRTLVFAFASLLVVIQNLVVDTVRAGFRDTADANWLPITSKQLYGVDAIEATFASGASCLILDNAGGGIFHWDPQELVLRKPGTQLTYHNTNVVDVAALQTGVVVSLAADQIGAASNLVAGQPIELVTTALSVTPTLVGNVTGQDVETPDDLRERDLDSLGALSPDGAPGAYEYVAKTPTLNGGVAVNRTKIVPPPGDGTLTLVIAGPAGPVSAGDVTLVQTAIDEKATPEVVTATVVSATAIALSFETTITVARKGAPDNATLNKMIADALVAFIATVPIGGLPGGVGIPWRTVTGVIENASPDGGQTKPVVQAVLIPETDIALTSLQVPTLVTASVLVHVTLVT